MAAADRFWARVQGRGGHGAMPHLAVDPVVAAAAIVAALQPLVSRETSPTSAAVVTVAEFNTGEPTVVSGLLKAACAAPLRALHVARHLWRPRSLPCLRPRLYAASGSVTAQQSLTRMSRVMKRCSRAGPGAPNVIPDAVELSGTIRALTTEHFERLRSRVAQARPPQQRRPWRCEGGRSGEACAAVAPRRACRGGEAQAAVRGVVVRIRPLLCAGNCHSTFVCQTGAPGDLPILSLFPVVPCSMSDLRKWSARGRSKARPAPCSRQPCCALLGWARSPAHARARQVISSTAEAHGCTAALRWGDVAYGPTVNAPAMVARVQAAAQALGDRADFLRMEAPTMAAEDFGFMAGPPATENALPGASLPHAWSAHAVSFSAREARPLGQQPRSMMPHARLALPRGASAPAAQSRACPSPPCRRAIPDVILGGGRGPPRGGDGAALRRAEAVPAAMTFLGIRNESVGSVHGLHTPRFRMDESQLPVGAALHAAVALEFLDSHEGAGGSAAATRTESAAEL